MRYFCDYLVKFVGSRVSKTFVRIFLEVNVTAYSGKLRLK